MDNTDSSCLYICAFLNIKGQTGLKFDKQEQIENLVKNMKLMLSTFKK